MKMRTAITGVSGLVGAHLRSFLDAEGHSVIPIGRGPGNGGIHWDPSKDEIEASRLDGIDAVVHLAGENIGSSRWTAGRKEKILLSRIDGTSLISKTIVSLKAPPRVLISASAVGYYGDCGDRIITENHPAGSGFLADVCVQWESACEPARQAGIRVVNIRNGVVLSSKGGAIPKMLPPFRLGIGGPIAGGKQYVSWIHLHDLARAILALIVDEKISGPVNMTSPNPVTNSELTRAIASVIHRPAIMPIPAFAIRAIFGQMGQETVIQGQRVKPTVLQGMGFEWEYADIIAALKKELA